MGDSKRDQPSNRLRFTGWAFVVGAVLGLTATACLLPSPPEPEETLRAGIVLSPPVGEMLPCVGEASGVRLTEVRIEQTIADEDMHQAKAGDEIWLVSGRAENTNPDRPYVAMWANGYDAIGKRIAWTLDAAHVVGQALFTIGEGETMGFDLHVSFAEDVESIVVNACAYEVTPP